MSFERRGYVWVASLGIAALTLVGCTKTSENNPQSAESNPGEKSGGLLSRITESAKPITVPAGTPIRVVLNQSISSRDARAGDAFEATVVDPVVVVGKTVIPREARAKGHVVEARESGRLETVARLSLRLDSVEVGGKSYDIETNTISRSGSSHKKRNVEFIGGGAGLGALIGGVAGGGKGAAIGAAAGAGAGTATAAATGKKDITLPAEATLSFRLTQPVTLQVKG